MPLVAVWLIHDHTVKVFILKETAAAEDDLVLEVHEAGRTPERRGGPFDALGDGCGIFAEQVRVEHPLSVILLHCIERVSAISDRVSPMQVQYRLIY